jgi:mono/diheme cytochrome c family protein
MIKYVVAIIVSIVLASSATDADTIKEDVTTMSVLATLEALGKDVDHLKPNLLIVNASAEAGERLIKEGFATKGNGKATRQQSKHFVCTSCHNVVQEDPDLESMDPQARLEYSELRGIPYLQGTTLYGAVNRESFYNGDYYKKYGELVNPARNDLREAVKLCAVECAQGRKLADWELESVMAYLWDIGLQMDDLNLAGEELEWIQMTLDEGKQDQDVIDLIESRYIKASPATFSLPPADRAAGSGLVGDTDNGKLLYDNSCLHCHQNARYSYLHLDDTKLSFKHLKRHMSKYTRHSLYQVVRWGVPVKSGKESYMPQYPQEKMTDQQLADLRSYIESRA